MAAISVENLLDPDILERFKDISATPTTKILLLQAQQLRNQKRILAAVEAAELVPEFKTELKGP